MEERVQLLRDWYKAIMDHQGNDSRDERRFSHNILRQQRTGSTPQPSLHLFHPYPFPEYLGRLMTTEQGKPLSEAKGEVAYGASFIQFFAEQASRSFGETMPPIGPNKRIMVRQAPSPQACYRPTE